MTTSDSSHDRTKPPPVVLPASRPLSNDPHGRAPADGAPMSQREGEVSDRGERTTGPTDLSEHKVSHYDAPFPIEVNASLTTVQQYVEHELAAIVRDIQAADSQYDNLDGTRGGTIVNADSYRELSRWFSQGTLPTVLREQLRQEVPEYSLVQDDHVQSCRLIRTHFTSATTNPASAASKDRIQRWIRSSRVAGGGTVHVVVLNGGSASGKTRFITSTPEIIPADAVAFDSTLTSLPFAEELIRSARSHQKAILFCFLATDFGTAMTRMIDRACADGRYISASGMAKNHAQSRATMKGLVSKYSGQEDIRFRLFRSEHENVVPVSIDSFMSMPYAPHQDLCHDALMLVDQRASRIPADLYRRLAR